MSNKAKITEIAACIQRNFPSYELLAYSFTTDTITWALVYTGMRSDPYMLLQIFCEIRQTGFRYNPFIIYTTPTLDRMEELIRIQYSYPTMQGWKKIIRDFKKTYNAIDKTHT